jgi:hypothetical protein
MWGASAHNAGLLHAGLAPTITTRVIVREVRGMRKVLYLVAVFVPIVAIALAATVGFGFIRLPGVHAGSGPTTHTTAHQTTGRQPSTVTCTATGYIRDGINLTAALIDPAGTVSGPVNATGCNIGVYYDTGTGAIRNAEIWGANYFGVVNNGGNVSLTRSFIHDIGETPFNGTQHGVSVYWVFGSASSGVVSNNLIYRYQKGGIVINGNLASATVSGNEVLGLGPVNFIAQNGISSGGIIIVGGSCYGADLTTGTHVTGNTTAANDIGLWVSDIDVDPNNSNACIPPTTPTNIVVDHNTAEHNAVTNTTGDIIGAYQAGIADQGDGDVITNNRVCGMGYTTIATPPPYLFPIDITATNNVTAYSNYACAAASGPSVALGSSNLRHLRHVAHAAKPNALK